MSMAELSDDASRVNRLRQVSTAILASWMFSRKCDFAVKAAPAAGLEQLGEVFQPLLGEIAPARDNVAATCHVSSMCHEPARKRENGRRRNGTNHLHVTSDILWKTSALSSKRRYYTPLIDRKPEKYGIFRPIHSQAAPLHGGFARVGFFDVALQLISRCGDCRKDSARNERPVRGDNRTGQAIWALGVDGRSRRIQPRWGGITAPTYIGRSRVGARSKDRAIFLTFCQGFCGPKSGFGAEFIARQGDWLRRRPIYPRPWRPPAGSGPVSGEPAVGPGHLLRRARGETPATGTAGVAAMAETAAKASAAPAPN